ncbi:hypothetical protein N7462_007225 [Penicillium macrosclerotiorum]|uniref:uncharacterized protein n=1 Tax=Penicillium macrosclerotiorum TaxID=303699 RepID=UPI0025499129|nr:uncharacterized protein N7462_007225 [Penicillium macrosclerotiorum]KAJ5678981.1 hypothetical protein N7462_007225 [Penicillium macrosclerotiorum]
MRFAAATVALFAGLAAALPGADTTVYQTEEVTITSCAPTVTDCPASQTGVGATGSSSVPVIPTNTPVASGPAGGASGSPSAPAVVPSAPATTAPAVSVIPVVYTTCSPVVLTSYSTVPVATPTGNSPVGGTGVPHAPSSSKPAGTASPSASSTPVFNGAGAVSGSLTFAGVAAAAAFFLA